MSRIVITANGRGKRAKSLLRGTAGPYSHTESPAFLTPSRDAQSRKRTSALIADVQNGDDLLKQLNEQIQARDTHIAELNEQVVGLKAVMKLWESQSVATLDRQLRTANEEKTKLGREKLRLEGELLELGCRLAAQEHTFDQEKQSLEAKLAIFTAENDALKKDNVEKSHLEQVAKDDLQQLSEIMKEMTKLNSTLNDKIAVLNIDTEQALKDKYELSLRIQALDMIESESEQLRSQIATLEGRVATTSETSAKLLNLEHAVQTAVAELTNVVARIVTEEDVKKAVKDTISVLEAAKRKAGEADNIEDLVMKVKLAKKENEMLASKLEGERKCRQLQDERIRFIEGERDKTRAEMTNVEASLTKKIKEMEQSIESVQKRSQDNAFANRKMEDALNHANGENEALKAKLAQAKSQVQDMKRQYESQRTTLRTLQSDLLQVKSIIHTQEFKSKSKEKAFIELQHKLTALNEEVWKKETEVLRKESMRIRLEEEVRLLHAQNTSLAKQKTNGFKSASANVRRPDELTEVS